MATQPQSPHVPVETAKPMESGRPAGRGVSGAQLSVWLLSPRWTGTWASRGHEAEPEAGPEKHGQGHSLTASLFGAQERAIPGWPCPAPNAHHRCYFLSANNVPGAALHFLYPMSCLTLAQLCETGPIPPQTRELKRRAWWPSQVGQWSLTQRLPSQSLC